MKLKIKRPGIKAERRLLAVCHRCGEETPEAEAIQSRSVPDVPDLIELGISCAHCGDWVHARFDGPQLDPYRQKVTDAAAVLDVLKGKIALARANQGQAVPQSVVEEAIAEYERAKKRLKVEDDRFLATWRGKLGASRPQMAKS